MFKKLLAVCIMLFATSAFATMCPTLKIDGVSYNACKTTQGTCHYMTPYSTTINNAYVDLIGMPDKYWNNKPSLGNKECDDMPCSFDGPFIHWIYNYQNLVTSHYCPPVTCEPDPEPSCDGHCGEILKWNICVDGKKQETSKTCEACPCVPTHTPPVCTEQTCGQSLPWKDSCGNDEEPVVCPDCPPGPCVPQTPPDPKCDDQTYLVCGPNDTAVTGPTVTETVKGNPDLCPCVPTEEGKPVCTEESCGKTLEWINNCGDKKYVVCEECACVPVRECEENECGYKQDNCGQTFACRNNCPPPPPPPGEWPKPDCNRCEFASFINIRVWNEDENAEGGFEIAHFATPNAIRSFVVDFDDTAVYQIWVGKYNDVTTHKQLIPQITGPAFGEITIEMAGLPIQQWTEVWFTGGAGSMTMFLDTKYHIFIRGVVFKE